jgi:hypothetical protein
MARSFRSNTFYKVVSLSSREDFDRPSCPQENRRCLAGLSFEETIELKLLKNCPLRTTTEMLAGHSRANRQLPVKNVGSNFTGNMNER